MNHGTALGRTIDREVLREGIDAVRASVHHTSTASTDIAGSEAVDRVAVLISSGEGDCGSFGAVASELADQFTVC